MSVKKNQNSVKYLKEEYKKSFLYQIDKIIDFDKLKTIISCLRKGGGRRGYDIVFMLKCFLLSDWYNVSYRSLGKSLKTQFNFRKFTGMEKYKIVPSRTTFCNFRKALVEHNLLEKIPNEINRQLESKNLKLKNDGKKER